VLRLAEVSLAVGDADAARAWLESWVERQKKDVDALVRLRQLEIQSKRWDAVAKISARLVAITKDEDQVDAALNLFDAALHLGNPEEAKAGLEHARRKQPDEPRIRDAMRKVYEAMGAEREVAALLLEDARALDGDARLAVLRRVAEIGLRVGDVDLATPALEELRAAAPNDGHTLALLADAYVAQSRFDDAERLLDGAIEASKGRRTPELAALLQRKGRVVGSGGDRRQQLDLLQQAHMIDKTNATITVELAELAEALEEWDLAIKTLRVIAMNDAASAFERSDALLRQAKIAYRRDDRQRALLWARRALQDYPANEDAKAFLASMGE
jgi:tetratricopeptide (TPR) repeat protein